MIPISQDLQSYVKAAQNIDSLLHKVKKLSFEREFSTARGLIKNQGSDIVFCLEKDIFERSGEGAKPKYLPLIQVLKDRLSVVDYWNNEAERSFKLFRREK